MCNSRCQVCMKARTWRAASARKSSMLSVEEAITSSRPSTRLPSPAFMKSVAIAPSMMSRWSVAIATTNDFSNLFDNHSNKYLLKNLIVKEGCCNDMKDDLEISGFNDLEKIVVKKSSLKNLNSLKICNCEKLKTIEIEDGEEWCDGAFRNVKNVIIESI